MESLDELRDYESNPVIRRGSSAAESVAPTSFVLPPQVISRTHHRGKALAAAKFPEQPSAQPLPELPERVFARPPARTTEAIRPAQRRTVGKMGQKALAAAAICLTFTSASSALVHNREVMVSAAHEEERDDELRAKTADSILAAINQTKVLPELTLSRPPDAAAPSAPEAQETANNAKKTAEKTVAPKIAEEKAPVRPKTGRELVTAIKAHPNIASQSQRVEQSIEDVEDDEDKGKKRAEIAIKPQLLNIVHELAEEGYQVKIKSLSTGSHSANSHHYKGRAIDMSFADADEFKRAFGKLYEQRESFGIDELIYGGEKPAGTSNLDRGVDHDYGSHEEARHGGHIHLAIAENAETPIESQETRKEIAEAENPDPEGPDLKDVEDVAGPESVVPDEIDLGHINFEAVTSPMSGVSDEELRSMLKQTVKAGVPIRNASLLIANALQESGFNPNIYGDNGRAQGAFQWHPGRREGMPKGDIAKQIEWAIDVEMERDHQGGNDHNLHNIIKDPNADVDEVKRAIEKWLRWGHLGERWKYDADMWRQLSS